MMRKRLLLAAAALMASRTVAAQAPIQLERRGSPEPGAARLVERPSGIDLDLLIEAGEMGQKGATASQRSATFGFGLVALGQLADSVRIGSGVGYHRTVAPTSLTRSAASGAPSEFLLVPGFLTVPLVMKVSLGGSVEAVLEPALAVGWVTGALSRSGMTRLDYDSSPGFGAQLAVGLEARPFGPVGISFRAGLRALRPSLVCMRASVAGGPLQELARPEPVDVDLSGAFWDLGLTLRL